MGFKTYLLSSMITLMMAAAQSALAAAHVTITNKLIDGKKTWLPADIKVKASEPVELELVNTLPDPHGFNLPGLAPNVVVPGNSKTMVKFTATKKETIKFNCQLHPAHVGGSVVGE